eukprot:TRINITY_DN1515_c0_g1_i1.p1 TRINITY_DN1515_c0_g1~~TRINITY_DN1515_c0_g1_i1.p1  ORF type:complete len:1004 (+),score=408.84 TRINITY_DN1515_c0_g1_i1:80-3013(+)
MAVSAYEDLLQGYVAPWVASSKAISPDLAGAAELVEAAMKAQKDFIATAAGMKKPSEEKIGELCGPTGEKMGAVGEWGEKHQRGAFGKHLQMLGEGVAALGWVMVPTPMPHVKEMIQACMFYGNKVMMEQKGKDEKQVKWVKDWKEILEELVKYIKEYHTAGVAWNCGAGGGGGGAAAAAGGGDGGGGAASLSGFDDLLQCFVAPWVASSKAISPDLGAAAELVDGALKAQRDFLAKAVAMKKPSEEKIGELCGPTGEKMGAVGEYQEKNARGPFGKHLSMLSESVGAFGWVMVPTPVPHVKEMLTAGMFYGNKIMMEQKGKDEKQVKWVKDWKEVLEELGKYVKEHHTAGVAWNSAAGGGGGSAPTGAGTGGGGGGGAASVCEFDDFMQAHVAPWVASSKAISPELAGGAELVEAALKAQRDFIAAALGMKKPSEEKIGELCGPTSEKMGAVSEWHEKHQRGAFGKHLQTLAEGIAALEWVMMPTPVPHVKETVTACMFYGNKVMMEQKGKDDKQVKWIKDFKELLEALAAYVKAHHTAGVAWNSAAGSGGGASAAAAPVAAVGESVADYDQWMKQHLEPFVACSRKIAPEVGEMAELLGRAFAQQRAFLAAVAECKKPPDAAFQEALGPQIAAMTALGEHASPAVKRGPCGSHVTALEESGQAVAWVSLPTPVPHLAEVGSQVQFHVNKVLMAHKGDDGQKTWGSSLKALLQALQDYVKAHHRAGLSWKPGGKELKGAPSAPAAAAPAAPTGLAAEISKGTDISKGLKKVDDSQKVHKNRTGDAKPIDEAAIERKKASAAPRPQPKGGIPTGTARLELEGKKWTCEYHAGTRLDQKKVEVKVDRSQTLYVYACQHCYIKVEGKINAINLYKCKKVQLEFESCIGQLEITDCDGAEVQVKEKLPAVCIDKSTEVMLWLSRQSLDCDITTCASTCVNLTVPGKTDADDPVELAIAEQFIHKVGKGNKVATRCMEHSG